MKLQYKRTFVLFLVFLISLVFSFAQQKTRDTIWVPVYANVTDTITKSTSEANYKELFYRGVQVPKYDSITNGFIAKPLAQNLDDLLKQTQLDESYSVADIKGTGLENSLRTVEQFSFPFANILTANLATKLGLATNNPLLIGCKDGLYELTANDKELLSTKKMLNLLQTNGANTIDKSLYVRFRLLSFLIGNSNLDSDAYTWKSTDLLNGKVVIPYINSYQNQYMNFDAEYKLISQLVRTYKHFEPYGNRIKNIKNSSKKFIGFDVNLLSNVPYESWANEVAYIKNILTNEALDEIVNALPKGIYSPKTEQLFNILKERIANLDEIALQYYNLISPNKVVTATNANDLIDVHRTTNGTLISIYNEKEGKKSPIKAYEFSSKDTNEIWIYGLDGNDYFEVSKTSKKYIPIKLIGGDDADKYEIQNGTKVVVYDTNYQTFLVEKDKAKIRLSEEEYITTYDEKKHKHNDNRIKPKFGANPDDGLFLGVVDEYKVLGFEQNPFTQLHQVSANLYFGNLGFKVGYYGELANVCKGYNAFGVLGYQSPNYSSNFFGFGNETPNFDDNLKLDYNRVRMSTYDVKIGMLKRHKNYFMSANLFFESRKIDETPDRFVSSETLFFPEDDFFDRKNYIGVSGEYEYENISISLGDELIITPKITTKVAANTNEFSKTTIAVQPSVYLAHPLYGDKVSVNGTITYMHVFGDDIPFYQAANLGGNTGLRGYRNQRFTGQSSLCLSTNLEWYIKELKSEILPLQIGMLGGFDAGRVWAKNESSSEIHADFGAGFWIQTADLIKAELQAFNGNEGIRFAFNLSIGF